MPVTGFDYEARDRRILHDIRRSISNYVDLGFKYGMTGSNIRRIHQNALRRQAALASKGAHYEIDELPEKPTIAQQQARIEKTREALIAAQTQFVKELSEEKKALLGSKLHNWQGLDACGCRVANVLIACDYLTLADVCRETEHSLLRLPNFGRRSLRELKAALAADGLQLGLLC